MAIAGTTHWSLNASATANMVNGGGFNIANANFLTDLTTDTNTGNTASPVVSSASYNFVAGDVGHWVYIQSGTNWNVGWYQIASVAANKATLNAAVGAASVFRNGSYMPNLVVGISTVGTPTAGVFGVDYSQSTAAILTATDYTATGSSTTLTSSTGGFTRVMVGNIFHQTTTGTGAFGIVGWYEIVNFTNANNVVLDRTPNTGTASVGTTGFTGGSLGLNSTLDDDWADVILASNNIWIKFGTYILGESMNSAGVYTRTTVVKWVGFNTTRGDAPTGANRPTISNGASSFTGSSQTSLQNIIWTGTGTVVVSINTGQILNCTVINKSTTANRTAANMIDGSYCAYTEAVSYRGYAFAAQTGSAGTFLYCYAHDSSIGFRASGVTFGELVIFGCISANNYTSAVTASTTIPNMVIAGCTLYGAETPQGNGIDLASGTGAIKIMNSTISGFVTGINNASSGTSTNAIDQSNNYYNNTTDVVNWFKGDLTYAVNPQFTSAFQITGATATTSGSVLTQSGGDFSAVVDNVSYLYLISGTGITVGKYLITSHTTTTLTLDIAPGTNATADKVFNVALGNNFLPSSTYELAIQGYPGLYQGSNTTSYPVIGAVRRQPTASSTTYTSVRGRFT